MLTNYPVYRNAEYGEYDEEEADEEETKAEEKPVEAQVETEAAR